MNAFLDYFQLPVLDALGAALLHSLWQGALVAGGLALVLRLLRQAAPELRYALCGAALLLLFLLPITTWVMVYEPAVQAATNVTVRAEPAVPPTDGGPSPAAGVRAQPLPIVHGAPGVPWRAAGAALWLVGVLMLTLRYGAGLYGVSRLVRSGVPVSDPVWHDRFASLKRRLGIAKPVRLVTTDRTDQPLLVGWLRPVIVVPASVLTGLPADQVEAILIHELIHVRRHDYLMLMAQTAMETLFFYHPAVWWISARMRIEREYACDDAAAALAGGRAVYVRALAALDARRADAYGLALHANGGRLVDRVRRLVDPAPAPSTRTRPASWAMLVVLAIGCGALVAACEPRTRDDAEALYLAALEAGMRKDFPKAERLALQADAQGDLCASALLASMHHASRRVFVDGDYVESVPAWVGQDEAKGAAFEQRFVERLTDAAEDGDALAMVWLSTIYNERWRLDAVRHTQKDDSLSRYWVQRAADVGHPTAIRWRAGSEQRSGNLGAADSLFAEAARLGDDSAYMSWALMYLDSRLDALDPERYFQIASMAVEAGAQGVHRWLKGDLDALEREVARGNQEAIAYKAIADRHLLFERMADLPENPPDPDWMLPMLCYGNPPGL